MSALHQGTPAAQAAAGESKVAALERHYSVAEVAQIWGWSERKVREVFREQPGVLQSRLRTLRPRRRENVMLRIPESVLLRVHQGLSIQEPEPAGRRR